MNPIMMKVYQAPGVNKDETVDYIVKKVLVSQCVFVCVSVFLCFCVSVCVCVCVCDPWLLCLVFILFCFQVVAELLHGRHQDRGG